MEKKSNTLWIIAGIVVLVALIAGGIAVFSPNGHTIQNVNPGNTNAPMKPAPSSSIVGTMLADSPYANYAYLISSNSLSADAQKALTGFKLTKSSNADGSTTYTLTAINPEYKTQTYTVQSGQKLYFIERNLGDDAGEERFLGDDMALVVDAQGKIVLGPGTA
jgi:LysM repeat protein